MALLPTREMQALMNTDFSGIETRMSEWAREYIERPRAQAKLPILNYLNIFEGECKMSTDENERIKLSSKDAFNPNELADMVTREHPFMYTKGVKPEIKERKPVTRFLPHLSISENHKRITRSKRDSAKQKAKEEKKTHIDYHNHCVYVFVHQSLIHKAKTLEFEIPGNNQFIQASCGNWYCRISAIGHDIKLLKNFFSIVKAEKWKDRTNIDVLCSYEDI